LGLSADVETGAVVTDIEPGGVADAAGLSAGDVIVEVNQQPVDGPADVIEQLEKARADGQNNLLLRILRGESHIFVALPLATNGEGSGRGG
jgi:serine protease Do